MERVLELEKVSSGSIAIHSIILAKLVMTAKSKCGEKGQVDPSDTENTLVRVEAPFQWYVVCSSKTY